MSTAARRREQRHLRLSTAGRGCKRRRCLRIVNANEMPVLTRENVLESTLYFLQHRWRLWDYVRTPAGSLTWGVAARTHEEWPILSAVAPASMSASEVMGLRSNSRRGSVGGGQIVQAHPLLDSGRAESVRPDRGRKRLGSRTSGDHDRVSREAAPPLGATSSGGRTVRDFSDSLSSRATPFLWRRNPT